MVLNVRKYDHVVSAGTLGHCDCFLTYYITRHLLRTCFIAFQIRFRWERPSLNSNSSMLMPDPLLSFTIHAVRLWNLLPPDGRSCKTVSLFKNPLKEYYLYMLMYRYVCVYVFFIHCVYTLYFKFSSHRSAGWDFL